MIEDELKNLPELKNYKLTRDWRNAKADREVIVGMLKRGLERVKAEIENRAQDMR